MALLPTNIATGNSSHIAYTNQVNKKTNAWVDIEADYGAVGNDSTDNTTAITNARDALGADGGTLYIPPGIFRHTGFALNKAGIQVVGTGPASVLKYNGTGFGITATAFNRLTIKNLKLDAVTPANPDGHIKFSNTDYCNIENVEVANLTKTTAIAVVLEDFSFFNHLTNIYAQGGGPNVYNGIKLADLGGNLPNANWIQNCVFNGQSTSAGIGIDIEGDDCVLQGGEVTSFGTAIRVDGIRNTLYSPRMENCGTGVLNTATAFDLHVFHPVYDSVTTKRTFGTVVGLVYVASQDNGTRMKAQYVYPPTSEPLFLCDQGQNKKIEVDGTGLGFFGATTIAKPTVTGSRGGNAALASLLNQLATLGLITDSST